MAVLNGNLVGISFSDNTQLNIVGQDLMDSFITFSPEGSAFNEMAGAFETILGANGYMRYVAEVHIRADSPKFSVYYDRILSNANVSGTATVTLDNGRNFTISKIVIEPSPYTSDRKTGDGIFNIRCDMVVNKDLQGL